MRKRFRAKLVGRGPGGAWTFLPIPFDVEAVFGTRARVPVRGTLNGCAFRNSLQPNGDGTHSMPVNRELRRSAAAGPDDLVEVVIERDEASREPEIPTELGEALAGEPEIEALFERLSVSHKQEFVEWINTAKKPETRCRRVDKTLEMLRARTTPKG
jgi:hypothetical protein